MFLKRILTIISILLAIILVEVFRSITGIPITILDIILFPSGLLIVFVFARLLVKREAITGTNPEPMTALKRWGYFVFSFFLLALGIWAIDAGIETPFALFTGVKGAAHGYTVAVLGLLISGLSVLMLYVFGFKTKNSSNK